MKEFKPGDRVDFINEDDPTYGIIVYKIDEGSKEFNFLCKQFKEKYKKDYKETRVDRNGFDYYGPPFYAVLLEGRDDPEIACRKELEGPFDHIGNLIEEN